MNKKGMSEEQFRWIFILVAGALIMVFFGSIVVKQKQAQEDAISAAELQNMEFLMANAKAATGASTGVDFMQEIGFDCNSIRIGRLSKQTKEAIFAPELLKGRNLITWSLDYNMPYRATNLLFLTTDEVRYVFVYDEERYNPDLPTYSSSYSKSFDEFFNRLPDKVTKEKVPDTSVSALQDKNNYKVRLVFFDVDITPSPIKSASSIKIEGMNLEKGEIQFGGQTYHYIGLPSLYAALFSEDKENYECAMGKAFKKLKLASDVYYDKIDSLENNINMPTDCRNLYNPAKTDVRYISETGLINLKEQEKAEELEDLINDLKNTNAELIKASCPPIY